MITDAEFEALAKRVATLETLLGYVNGHAPSSLLSQIEKENKKAHRMGRDR